MRGANKSVQHLNYKYFNNFLWPRDSRAAFEAAQFRPPAARDSLVGSGPRYQICRTFLHIARVKKHTYVRELHAIQKTHGHARIARVERAILACPFVF